VVLEVKLQKIEGDKSRDCVSDVLNRCLNKDSGVNQK